MRKLKFTLAASGMIYLLLLTFLFSATHQFHWGAAENASKQLSENENEAALANDEGAYDGPVGTITIAILAKDKAHSLPLYLKCLEKQTWPKEKTNLYIRTNNNNDNTAEVLREWIGKVGDQYAEVYFDDSDLKIPLQTYKQHEWNLTRFKALGKIRQDSVDWAYDHHSHYFVADCDNFIKEDTIENLYYSQLPIVAPLLLTTTLYSNYHAAIDKYGYYEDSPFFQNILYQEIKGLIEVPLVHCTYFIDYTVLDKMSYDDNSTRYEYVIFSDNARLHGIPQYIDNREVYGYITFAETEEELNQEPWLRSFSEAILYHKRS